MTKQEYQYQEWRKRYIARHARCGMPAELMARILDAEKNHECILSGLGSWVCSRYDWLASGYVIECGEIVLNKRGGLSNIPVVKVYNPNERVKKVQIIPTDMLKEYAA